MNEQFIQSGAGKVNLRSCPSMFLNPGAEKCTIPRITHTFLSCTTFMLHKPRQIGCGQNQTCLKYLVGLWLLWSHRSSVLNVFTLQSNLHQPSGLLVSFTATLVWTDALAYNCWKYSSVQNEMEKLTVIRPWMIVSSDKLIALLRSKAHLVKHVVLHEDNRMTSIYSRYSRQQCFRGWFH